MISVLILSLLLATIQAASPVCGPSSPSGFMVVALDGAGSGKSNICNEFNMDPADVTTSTANEASNVIFSCLGYMRHALINSYYGQTYDETCLSGYVSSTSPGLSIGVSPDCSSANAVLCKQRRNQAITIPMATTTSTIVTTLPPSSTATTTSPISYPTVPAEKSPCTSPDGLVTVFAQNSSASQGDSTCYQYGMYIAEVKDMQADGITNCMAELGTDGALIAAAVPGNFGVSFIRASISTISEVIFSNVTVMRQSASTKYLCMTIVNVDGVFEYQYQAYPSGTGIISFDVADQFCSDLNQMPAIYPLNERPLIQGLDPTISRIVTRVQLPVPSECASLFVSTDLDNVPLANARFSLEEDCTANVFEYVVCRPWNAM